MVVPGGMGYLGYKDQLDLPEDQLGPHDLQDLLGPLGLPDPLAPAVEGPSTPGGGRVPAHE
jgi:hypothetical protein